MSSDLDSDRFFQVSGNPTSEEIAVLTSVIGSLTSVDTDPHNSGQQAPDTGPTAHSDSVPESSPDSSARERLEQHRVCPICERSFDSKYELGERNRLDTARNSTLCFDKDHDTIYQHLQRNRTKFSSE